MKNIIITGAGGFIGYNISKSLIQKKYNVIGVDNLSRQGSSIRINNLKKISKNFVFKKCDIRDYKKLKNIYGDINNLSSTIHTAGQVTVTDSILDPINDFKINSLGTLHLLELTKKLHKKSKFIFSSTNKVYGDLEKLKTNKKKNKYYFQKYKNGINENFNVDYCSPYGCSKGSADQYVIDFGRLFNMNTVVLRKSCIYGQDQLGTLGQGWISFLINQAIMKKKITIFGNGYQTRDILYIDDLVDVYEKILERNSNGYEIFNIGGGKNNLLSVNDLMYFLKEKKLINNKINYSSKRLGDQKTYYSDLNKIKNKYSWQPKISKEEGLERILNFSLGNINLINKIYK